MVRSVALAAIVLGLGWAQTQDDLAEQSQRARQLMAAGRYAEAIPIYAALVRALPDNPGLIMNLGLAQQMAGRLREAVPNFQAAVKLEPKLYPAWTSLGACWLDLGEPAKAVAPLEKAVSLQPQDARVRLMLAEALLAVERFEAAARQYRTLGEQDAGNPRVWYGLGRSYEALSQRAFERLTKLGEGSAWWLALVAETRLSQGQNSSAFALYKEAQAKAPGMRGIQAGLAEVYRRTGHPDWAAAAEARERALPAPDCCVAARECAYRAGRYLEAARAPQRPTVESQYWQARAYNMLAGGAFSHLAQLPPSAELYRLQAQIETGRRRPLEAAKQLREALKLQPGDAQLRLELAIALHDSRDYKAAQEITAELLKGDPESAVLNFMHGDIFLRQEQPEKAVPYLEKAVRGDPGQVAAQASLGLAYARTGQAAKAVPHLKAALDSDTDGSLHYQLGRAYQATGQGEAAREMMRQYQDLQQRAQPEEVKITPP